MDFVSADANARHDCFNHHVTVRKKSFSWSYVVWCLVLAASLLVARPSALADGGVVRLRKAVGPFIVTVFSSPVTLVHPSDVSVMVQQGDTGTLVLDASVDLFFIAPEGVTISAAELFCGPDGTPLRSVSPGFSSEPRALRASRERATNKLLYGATVNLPAAGTWQMRVRVRHRDAEANVLCAFPVVSGDRRLASAWPCLAIPPLFIALFATHQRLRRRRTGAIHSKSGNLPQELGGA
jgi:hypothetical protein